MSNALTLVPLDGSMFAEQALHPAQYLAQRYGAAVRLVRVEAAGSGLLREAPDYLERTAASIEASGLSVSFVLREGTATSEILSEARSCCASVIVMATHGRSGVGRWLYGSTADYVLHHSPVPVMLVQPQSHATAWLQDRPLRVVVPLDTSPVAEAVLPCLFDLIAAGPTEIILVEVIDLARYGLYTDPTVLLPFDSDEETRGATGYLEEIGTRLRAVGGFVSTRVELGPVARTLADVAEQEDAHLILMATHGRGGVARAVLGSVATDTLRHSPVPLLLVRPVPVSQEPAPELAATRGS